MLYPVLHRLAREALVEARVGVAHACVALPNGALLAALVIAPWRGALQLRAPA